MTDKLKHFSNNIEAEFWNENKKFLVQDLALSAMVSFLKHGSVSNNNVLSQLFIFSLFFDTIFFTQTPLYFYACPYPIPTEELKILMKIVDI